MFLMATEETLDILSKDCNERYCTFREFFRRKTIQDFMEIDCLGCDGGKFCDLKKRALKYEDRTLFQFKEIELFKFFIGEDTKIDIGFDETAFKWIREGYAGLFHELYDIEGIRDPLCIFGTSRERLKKYRTTTA